MKRVVLKFALPCVAAILLVAGAWAGSGGTWVSEEGTTVDLGVDHGAFFFADGDADVETIDLSSLADGESRTFGTEDPITTTRRGDEVTIERRRSGEHEDLTVVCDLGRDTCKVLVSGDDAGTVAVVIEKHRECIGGAGDCEDLDVNVHPFGGHGERVMVRRVVECDGDEDCEKGGSVHRIRIAEALAGSGTEDVFVVHDDEAAGSAIIELLQGDDRVSLRCPEGDATLRVAEDEADRVYLCPKHSVPMERSSHAPSLRKFKVQRKN